MTVTINGTSGITLPSGSTAVGTTDSQTLTNKTISGASNTLSNIGNSSLTNSSVTLNGTSVSLGGTGSISTLVNGSFTASLTSVGQLQIPVITQGGYTGGQIVALGNVLFNANGNIWKFGSDGTMSSPYSVGITTSGFTIPGATSGSISLNTVAIAGTNTIT